MKAQTLLGSLAIAIFAIAPSDGLSAQARNDSLALRNDCKRVEQILKTHHPTAQLMWAVNHVSACGTDGARFAGTFIRSIDSDPSDSVVEAALYLSAQVRAREIFESGLSLASSGGTPRARLIGLLVTTRQVAPSLLISLPNLESARPGRRCVQGHASGPGPWVVSDIPADAVGRLRTAAAALHDSGVIADNLSNAADCIEYEMHLIQAADSTD